MMLVFLSGLGCFGGGSSTSSSYSDNSSEPEDEIQENKILNGPYCATVHYFNPNTGTQSDYQLIVEVSDNQLQRINFPQGWMDQSNFSMVEFDANGNTQFVNDKGYQYSVEIIGEADDCFSGMPALNQCLAILENGIQCERVTDNPNRLCWQHQSAIPPAESKRVTEAVFINTDGNVKLRVSEEMREEDIRKFNLGDFISLREYINTFDFKTTAKLMYIEELGDNILFISTYTGGAHCCVRIEAFKPDRGSDFYYYLDRMSFDGEFMKLDYPFTVNLWHEYFHCPYAFGFSECNYKFYNDYLHIVNGKFVPKAQGDKDQLEQCLLEFFRTNQVPELMDNFDEGQREVILNSLRQLYNLTEDMEYIKNLYMEKMPPVKDKLKLWNEMSEIILSQKRTYEKFPFR